MSQQLPPLPKRIAQEFPDLWQAYENLGQACSQAGPIDASAQRLVKLALALAAKSEGAVHSHTRRALDEGETPAALRQVALLAIPNLGFASAMAGLSWIEDIIQQKAGNGGGR